MEDLDMRVLVVDDNEDGREQLIAELINCGFSKDNLMGVETGEEAVAMVRERTGFFDVVVIDHKLKGKMDGIEATKEISDYSRYSQYPREIFPIIFTNVISDDPETIGFYREKAYVAGAYRYLHRSEPGESVIQVRDFITEIKQLLQLREKVRTFYEAQKNVPSLLTRFDIMIALIDRGFKYWYTNPEKEKFRDMNAFTHSSCPISFRECCKTLMCGECIVAKTLLDGKNHERIYIQPANKYDDRLRWIKMWTQPMQDENGEAILLDDGKPLAVLESSQDITDGEVLKAIPIEKRLDIIAQSLYEREDGFERVRIFKADFDTEGRKSILNLLAYAGYPREIPQSLLDIGYLSHVKKSIRYFKRHKKGLFHEQPGNMDTICPDEKMERFIQWPLMKGERLIGMISVSEAEGRRRCTENGISMIESYAREVLRTFESRAENKDDREIEEKLHEIENLLITKRSPEDSLYTLIDEVFRLTDSDNVFIRYASEDRARLLLPFGKGPYVEKAPLDIPLSHPMPPTVRTAVTGLEEARNNAGRDPEVKGFTEDILEGEAKKEMEKINAFCIQPLIFRNRCIGSLNMSKNGTKTFTTKQIKIARKLAKPISLMVRDYLKSIDYKIKTYAFDASMDAIAFTDLKYKINIVNPAFLKLWGYADENEVIGKPFANFWNRPTEAVIMLEKLQNKKWEGEMQALKKDGTLFEANVKANIAADVSKRPIGYVVSIMDITERKRAEKIRESIYRISEEASCAQNLDALYKSIHDIIKGLIPADNFYIALYDEKKNQLRFPYFVDETDDTGPSLLEHGKSMTSYVIRTGKPILASARECEELEDNGEVVRHGEPARHWLGVPLKKKDNKIIGVLAVQIYKPGLKYEPEDKDMIEFVSTQIAMAIQRKREEQNKERLVKGSKNLE